MAANQPYQGFTAFCNSLIGRQVKVGLLVGAYDSGNRAENNTMTGTLVGVSDDSILIRQHRGDIAIMRNAIAFVLESGASRSSTVQQS